MAKLPSGAHFCIQDTPLEHLFQSLKSGLTIPDLLLISSLDDLRRHIRFCWLLSLGADCASWIYYDPRSAHVPAGLTLVDSGRTIECPPDSLDRRDRAALETFWQSRRCQSWLAERMDRVRHFQASLRTSSAPEDQLIVSWFTTAQPHLSQHRFPAEKMTA
ncbi:MAG: hypothetical protein CJBNEKGG_03903 [Prosthecobacter sp.]|nr:hypothetical protein [Prosthecobacter sp.]